MVKLYIVVGLPGSGKSHLLRELSKLCSGVCAEDYMASSINDSPQFTDSRYYGDLIKDLQEGKDRVIADIEFCDTWRRIEVEQVVRQDVPEVTIEWRFFENDPEKCIANVERRGRKNMEKEKFKIRHLSRKYHIPACAERIPIWTSENEEDI